MKCIDFPLEEEPCFPVSNPILSMDSTYHTPFDSIYVDVSCCKQISQLFVNGLQESTRMMPKKGPYHRIRAWYTSFEMYTTHVFSVQL